MMDGRRVYLVVVTLCGATFLGSALSPNVQAQNIAVSTPTFRFGESSFENVGGGFGFNGGGAGAQFGFSIPGHGGRFNFNLSAAQGNSRSISSATPMVVVPNGGTGTIIDVVQRPFVVGFTPVVGGWSNSIVVPPSVPSFSIGPTVSPLQDRIRRFANGERGPEIGIVDGSDSVHRKVDDESESKVADRRSTQHSSAEQPDISVRQIRQQLEAQDAAEEAQVAAYVVKARQAESGGDLSGAIGLIDKARRESRGARRRKFEEELRALRIRMRATQGK